MISKTNDLREIPLQTAALCFSEKTITYNKITYTGEDAIDIGFDLISLVQSLDRKYLAQKNRRS